MTGTGHRVLTQNRRKRMSACDHGPWRGNGLPTAKNQWGVGGGGDYFAHGMVVRWVWGINVRDNETKKSRRGTGCEFNWFSFRFPYLIYHGINQINFVETLKIHCISQTVEKLVELFV